MMPVTIFVSDEEVVALEVAHAWLERPAGDLGNVYDGLLAKIYAAVREQEAGR